MDSRAIQWARVFNPGSSIINGSIDQIHARFYSASLIEVIEHIQPEDLPRFLMKCAQSLHPGGTLICTVPSILKSVPPKHYQHFSAESLKRTLNPFFKSVSICGFERDSFLTKLALQLRMNSYLRIDSPFLNRLIVSKNKRLHSSSGDCGRLLAICVK